MKLLDDSLNMEGLFSLVEKTPGSALMLDYDGTLAPFAVRRDRAYPYPGVGPALGGLMEAGCRVVLVSGRGVYDLIPLLGLDRVPEIWGSHGWERLGPSGYEPAKLPGGMDEALDGMREWAAKMQLGEQFERKPVGAAVHVRGLGKREAERLIRLASDKMADVAAASGLELHEFDGGLELRPPGRDKGYAVRTLLGELEPGAAAAYLGDDLTDEDAFTAISGSGLGVLVRKEFRETAAKLWIRPPEELLWFIGRWAGACGGR